VPSAPPSVPDLVGLREPLEGLEIDVRLRDPVDALPGVVGVVEAPVEPPTRIEVVGIEDGDRVVAGSLKPFGQRRDAPAHAQVVGLEAVVGRVEAGEQ
jgi:hypothetical protein